MQTSRTEQIAEALGYLANATQAEPSDEAFQTYERGLESFDTATIAEACARLSASERRFPSLSAIRDVCREVLRVGEVQTDALHRTERYQAFTPMPQARAKAWQDHLKAVVSAKRNGLPPPSPLEPLVFDDPRTMARCHACRDTGWIEDQCVGGQGRSCGRGQSHRFVSVDKKAYFEGSCRTAHSFVRRCSCR